MSKKMKIFLVGCMLMVMCCMGITAGASEDAKAEVIAHSLTITDAGINVNFYVDIQGEVEVTLDGTQVNVPENTVTKIIDAKAYNCYKFTQPVVAKEMDKKVSLVIKSGENPLVNDSYCVNDYATSVIGDKYNYNYEELVKAMTYYGDFAETYLNYQADKTDGATEFLDQFDDNAQNKLTGDDYKIKKENSVDGIEASGIQLNLVSEVSIRLNFNVTDDKALDYEFTAVSGDVTKNLGTLKKGSYSGTAYYYVDIENIGADALDKEYIIKVGDTTVLSNCSALSYARAALKSETASDSLVNLAKALYLYNQKAKTYVSSQTAAVYDIFYGSEGFSATPDGQTPVYLTGNDDITTEESDDKVETFADLEGSRTKGCSIWMKAAYTVSETEETLSGPYVIRRYNDYTGNLLNVTGTATLETTVDRSEGEFVAQYPDDTVKVTISELADSEVYVSGTLNVTGNAKTGVITVEEDVANINANGLTADGEVVFASHEGVNLSGDGNVSAISLLDDGAGHFGIVKADNNLRIASIICVCGENVKDAESHTCAWSGTSGISKVYDIEWQPWNASVGKDEWNRVGLPWTAGSYYLTKNITGITRTAELKMVDGVQTTVNLDLAGFTATGEGKDGRLCTLDGGIFNIADSSEGKTGAIQCTGEVTTTGRIVCILGSTSSSSCVNLFGGTLSADENATGGILRLNNGTFNMYKGTILPGTSSETTGPNSIIIGGETSETDAYLNILGGTIKGEVMLRTERAKLNISGSAKLGVSDGSNKGYGIYPYSDITSALSITCNDVAMVDGGKNIVLKDDRFLTLDGTGEGSAFEISVNKHNQVVDDNEDGMGTLSYTARMCVCGAVDAHTQVGSCYVPTEAWQPWDADISKATDKVTNNKERIMLPGKTGSYYLVNDMIGDNALTDLTGLSNLVIVNIDLAGHTAQGATTLTRIINMNNASLNITDSSENETGLLQCTGESTAAARVIRLQESKSNNVVVLYKGKLSAKGATGLTGLVVKRFSSGGTFTMYGGTVEGNGVTDIKAIDGATSHVKIIGGTVTD